MSGYFNFLRPNGQTEEEFLKQNGAEVDLDSLTKVPANLTFAALLSDGLSKMMLTARNKKEFDAVVKSAILQKEFSQSFYLVPSLAF